MNKILIWITSLVVLFIYGTSQVQATSYDPRIAQMRTILAKYNSPMLGLEDTLISTAEKYGLDWTLMAAIAGTESGFARRMPHNCHNPYGWGIYGTNKLCFESLEASIEGVASGLAKKYNISSLETIAYTYNKANTSKWLANTTFFMNKIKNAPIPVSSLPITL